MLRRLLPRVQQFILRRPGLVLSASLGLAVAGVLLGRGVELRTSRSELAPQGDPDQARWQRLLEQDRGSEAVVACIEADGAGADPAGLRRFADALAAEVARDPQVERVFHRVDVDWMLSRVLYLVPAETLAEVAGGVAAERDALSALAAAPSWASFNELVARRIESGIAAAAGADARSAVALRALAAGVEAEREFLEHPASAVERWTARPALLALGAGELAGSDGYLETRDGATLFVLIIPREADDSLPAQRRLVSALRERSSRVAAERPGFRVGLTGTAAMNVEEMATIRRDTRVTSVAAVSGVALLTLLVFRWRTHAFLVLLALAIGLAWSLGAVRLELGYLNLITSSFLATLIGVGVAYGIHPVSEYELEGAHTADPEQAVRESFRRTAPAVSVAGITTAVAFLSILLMRFRGFAELGLVAGVGVLLCLAAALVSLPAALVLYGRRRRRRDRRRRDAGAALDRLWLERWASRICRFPRRVTAAALVLTLAAAWAATGLGFDTNILELLPENAESSHYQRRMIVESDLSPAYNIVVARDLDELEQMSGRAAGEPEIARFESVLGFLPGDPVAARAAAARLDSVLATLRWPEAAPALEPDGLRASLDRLERALERAAESAFTAGLADLVEPLERAGAAAGQARAIAAGPPDPAWQPAETALVAWLGAGLDAVRAATRAAPPTPESLPREIRERFFTGDGRPLGFLHPAGDVFDPAALDRYVAASLRVSPEAIGFPFMFHKMSRRITRGFYRAVAAGGVLVLVILLIDLRSLRHALLAIAPLAIGIVWTLGGMRLLGVSFTFANLVAVPLILGVGIDNGVHVVHRFRIEGQRGMGVVLRHTGRAILIASLTTMIGFGSLALASHRGLSSLGLLLLLGVGSCLVTSMVVLPNLMVALGIAER